MSQYYYLVSGLPEISPDDLKTSLSYTQYLEEWLQMLSKADSRLLSYFRMTYENRNLLTWLRDREAPLHPLGQLSAEDFMEQWQRIDFDDLPPLKGIPPYFLPFLREYAEGKLTEMTAPNRLSALFYEYTQQCSNRFVREWFAYEWKLKNLMVALNCRRLHLEIAPQLVGENEFCQQLASSTARDFGLQSVFPQTETVLRLMDDSDLLQRERKLDAMSWEYLDGLCTSYYFSVEVLLAYLVKLQMIERWMQLDAKAGEEMFRQLIASMKEGVRIPQ